MKKIFLTYCFIIFPFLLLANGVLFSGNSSRVDKRTSYSVFNQDRIPSFQDEITMNFEIKIKEFNTFGYIFSLKDQITDKSYILVFTFDNNSKSLFQFNTEGQYNHTTIKFHNDSINNKWIPISLTLNKKEQLINISILGQKKQIKLDLGTESKICPEIIFGKKDYMVDLPTFALRNLKIYDKQHSYKFPFTESNGNVVHNYKGEAMGSIENPTWLINDSYYWKNIFETKKKGICTITSDNDNIYIVAQDSLTNFCLNQNHMSTCAYVNEIPLLINLGTGFYDVTTHNICLYEPDTPKGKVSVAALNLDSMKWETVGYQSLPSQLHHHNKFFDSRQHKIYLFGGFGNQRYHKTFLSYDLIEKKIDTLTIKGATIDPRFYAGLASKGDSIIFLYGGVGNHNGMQSLGKKYYNDLYEINLHNLSLVKKWEFPSDINQAVGNSMVFSDKENALYALKYKEYDKHSSVQLYKIGLDNNQIEKVGNTIPFLSEAIKTSLSLIYSKSLEKIYCVIHECTDSSDTTRIAAYELAFPPVSYRDINKVLTKKDDSYTYVIPVAILILSLCISMVIWKRKKKENKANEQVDMEVEEIEQSREIKSPEDCFPHKNSIYLYGIFTVFDSQGKDITYMFSAKLKNIFIYILTCETEEGILSSSLNNIFWADKDESKIKNLKGVTINHLRKILTEIDGISLIYKNKYFYLDIQEPCYCDYIESIRILNKKFQPRLLSILQRGKLMDGINEELFDYTKCRIEDFLLNYLTNELLVNVTEFNNNKVDICQAILSIDPLNEDALSILIKIYEHHRMKVPALEAYSIFTKEYKRTMDKEYPYSLEDLLRRK